MLGVSRSSSTTYFPPVEITAVGNSFPNPQRAMSISWGPILPMSPLPVSQNQCQLYLNRSGLNARIGAGPRNLSQSTPGGTGPSGACPRERRLLKQMALARYTLPMMPSCRSPMAFRLWGMLRLCEPTWTMRRYLRAASVIRSPSNTLWDAGFSMYTSLPAWQAQMVASACQIGGYEAGVDQWGAAIRTRIIKGTCWSAKRKQI